VLNEPEDGQLPTGEPIGEGIGAEAEGTSESLWRRTWNRAAYAFKWMCNPDEVGRPITLKPRNFRAFIFLLLGNVIVLAFVLVGVYQAIQAPEPVQPVFIIPTAPAPSPTSTATPAPSPTPFGSGGAIAFTLRRNGNTDVYALNQSDRRLIRLTNDPSDDRGPAWSPDGNYVAFASNRANNWDIYLLDLLSGVLIRLTHDPHYDANPTWSPDGQWIAFETYRHGNLDIYVMSTTGQQLRRITDDAAPNYEPAWSPDSQALAYTTFVSGTKDIFVQRIDDSGGAINITRSPDVDEYMPAWAPNGKQIAYVSGPIGNPSIQIATFDWDTMEIDHTQTELFGAGTSPVWSPDSQSFIYVYERGGWSHIVAASVAGWGLFHEIYSSADPMDDLAWSSVALSPRIIAQAQNNTPLDSPGETLYIELMKPTATAGPPYELIPLPNVTVEALQAPGNTPTPTREAREAEEDEEADEYEVGEETEGTPTPEKPTPTPRPKDDVGPFLSDRVNESFNALRQKLIEETGWDYLAYLDRVQISMNHSPPSGHPRKSWHVCGRAFSLNQEPYGMRQPQIELAREDVGNTTYWRVYVRTAVQDGSMGEPLRQGIWDLNARQEGGQALVEGGALKLHIPTGYYVDFTALARDYGWERVPALWRWRYFWPDVRWWEYLNTGDITWWECMLDVFSPQEIEAAFGPIPPEHRPHTGLEGQEKEKGADG